MTCSLLGLHKKLFSMPWAALAIIAVGFVAIAGALTLQSLGLAAPCILCIYQRIPYLIVGVLGLLALALRKREKAWRGIFALCALAFLVNVGIAAFHSGVERQWWAGTDGCAVNPEVLRDPEAARLALLETAVSNCDQIDFTFLGLSLANWNIVIGLVLGIYALLVAFGPCTRWVKPCCCCGTKPPAP